MGYHAGGGNRERAHERAPDAGARRRRECFGECFGGGDSRARDARGHRRGARAARRLRARLARGHIFLFFCCFRVFAFPRRETRRDARNARESPLEGAEGARVGARFGGSEEALSDGGRGARAARARSRLRVLAGRERVRGHGDWRARRGGAASAWRGGQRAPARGGGGEARGGEARGARRRRTRARRNGDGGADARERGVARGGGVGGGERRRSAWFGRTDRPFAAVWRHARS